MSSLIPPATGKSRLVAWANKQDGWTRSIVAHAVTTRRPLPDAALDEVYSIFLLEKELADGEKPVVPSLSAGMGAGAGASDLRLVRVSGVTGVNALATGQTIEFNKSLTVLFGENAAGKTGYVRILKRVAQVRTAEEVIGDIRKPGAPSAQSATIEYDDAGQAGTVAWKGEQGIPPLTRMSIFDSRVAALHVDEDLTYLYTPGEVAIFQYVHQGVEAVRTRLEKDKTAKQPKSNPFLAQFQKDTTVYPKIDGLGPTTDITALEKLASVSSEEEASVQQLRDSVAALQPQTVEMRRKLLRVERDFLSAIRDSAKVVSDFSWQGYQAVCATVSAAQAKYAQSGEASFSQDKGSGILGDSWRAFVQAGDLYWQERHGADGHPKEGDECLYCGQTLTAAAAALLEKYVDFCRSTHRQDLERAIMERKRLACSIQDVDAGALNRSAKARQQPGISSANEKLLANVIQLGTGILGAQGAMSEGNAPDAADLVQLAQDLVKELSSAITSIDDEDSVLKAQASEREKAARAKSEQLRTLENRLALRALISGIRTYVEQAKWVSLATTVGQRFTGVLRSLTEESKVASEQLLNQDFEKRFNDECTLLRAPKVVLDFPGRKGQAARKKSLVADHRLSETLSEGEQKAIAFADFLAETGLQPGAAPLVLDDPVNSLDYKRVKEVVDRVVSLVETRQVVVFTHNILFATGLLGKFEKRKTECTFYSVVEEDGTIGIITPGTHPRWDTEAHLKKRVEKLVEEAGKATGEERTAKIEYAYGVMRSWCEVFVEQELLKSVSQRYQANIKMTVLGDIRVDRLDAARKVVVPIFDKACRMMPDHSQPLETLGVRAKIEELREDWKKACDARNAYLAP